jgi:hypothetical protein
MKKSASLDSMTIEISMIIELTIWPQSKKTQSAMASMHTLQSSLSLAVALSSSFAKNK